MKDQYRPGRWREMWVTIRQYSLAAADLLLAAHGGAAPPHKETSPSHLTAWSEGSLMNQRFSELQN